MVNELYIRLESNGLVHTVNYQTPDGHPIELLRSTGIRFFNGLIDRVKRAKDDTDE